MMNKNKFKNYNNNKLKEIIIINQLLKRKNLIKIQIENIKKMTMILKLNNLEIKLKKKIDIKIKNLFTI